MLRKPNETLRFSFWFEDTAGAGVALSPLPTVKVYDPSGTLIVNGSNCSASGPTGGYHYDHAYSGTPHMAGRWLGVATTSQTVQSKERPSIVDVDVAGVSYLDVSVNSRLASASYTAPPTANAVADQVWDEALSGHVAAGSAGVALAAAGGASDPLLNTVPGTYAQGTAGYSLGRIGNGVIRTVYPVSPDGTSLTLYRGDSYLNTSSEALTWSDLTGSAWPDLTASPAPTSITLGLRSQINDELVLSVTATATAARAIRADITASQSAALPVGKLDFDVQATWLSGRVRTLVYGEATVLEDQVR